MALNQAAVLVITQSVRDGKELKLLLPTYFKMSIILWQFSKTRNRIFPILYFFCFWFYKISVFSQSSLLQEKFSFYLPQNQKQKYYMVEWWTVRKYKDTLYHFSEKGIRKYNLQGKLFATVYPFYWRMNPIKGAVMKWYIKSIPIRCGYQVNDLGFLVSKFDGIQFIPLSFSGNPLRLMTLSAQENTVEQKIFLSENNNSNVRFLRNYHSDPEFFLYHNKLIISLTPFDSVPDNILNQTCGYLHQLDNSHYQQKNPRLSIHTFDERNFVASDSNNFEGQAEKNYLSPPIFIGHIEEAESLAAASNRFYPYPNSVLFAVDTLKEQVYIGSFSLPQIQVCNLEMIKEQSVSCINYFSEERLSRLPHAQTVALPKPIDSDWEKSEVRYWEKKIGCDRNLAKYFSVMNMQLYYSHSSGLLYRLQKKPDSIYTRKQISTWVKRNRFKYAKAQYDKPAILQILDPEKPGALIAEIPVPPHFRILDTEPGGIIWAVKEVNKKEIIIAKYRLDLEGLKEGKNEKE
jgi:hypothetical protein